MLGSGIRQVKKVWSKGPLHVQDDRKIIGCLNVCYLVIPAGEGCARVGILIETPPVLKIARHDGLPIRPAQIVAQMHHNRLSLILHTTMLRQWHLRQLIGMNMKLLIIEDGTSPKRIIQSEIRGRAGEEGVHGARKLKASQNQLAGMGVSGRNGGKAIRPKKRSRR